MKNYIIDRLCEKSTWRGIIVSLGSIIGMFAYYFDPRHLVMAAGIFAVLISQVSIWTKDHKKTKSKLDDILYAFASAFKDVKEEKNVSSRSTIQK